MFAFYFGTYNTQFQKIILYLVLIISNNKTFLKTECEISDKLFLILILIYYVS